MKMTEELSKQTKSFIRSLLTSTPYALTIRKLEIDYKNTIGEDVPFHRMGYSSLEQYLRAISDVVVVKGGGWNAELVPVLSEKSAHISEMVMAQKVTKKGPRRQTITNRKTIRYPQTQPKKPVIDAKPCTSSAASVFNENKTNNSTVTTINKPKITIKIGENAIKNILSGKINENTKNIPNKKVDDSNIPIDVQENLKKLIAQHEDGIWCAELPIIYKKQFGTNLNFKEYGYRCLINMCSALPHIFRFIRPGLGDFKLYDIRKPLPDILEDGETKIVEEIHEISDEKEDPTNIEITDYLMVFPKDIFLESEIKRAFLPPHIKENDTVEIVVAEIYDPSKFWVYLNDNILNNLMDEMQEFYKEHAKEYEIPPHLLREGMYCTQIILGEYHRGLIIDTLDYIPEKVKVLFIDYGTMTKVSMRGICFLTKYFANLPAQAIRCRLANIKPIFENSTWPTETTERFKQLVTGRDISAKINTINKQDKYIEVYLADTTEKKIIYVNDTLVDETFAIKIDEAQQLDKFVSNFQPITKSIHLFPTFFELEYGLVPSSTDTKELLMDGVPVNFCLPQYFTNVNKKLDEEPEIIKHIEEITDKLDELSEIPIEHDYNIDELKRKELDFSVFGDLEEEIREFVGQTRYKREEQGEEMNLSHLLCDLDLGTSDDDEEEVDNIVNSTNSTNPFLQGDLIPVKNSSTNPFLYDLDNDDVINVPNSDIKQFFNDLKMEQRSKSPSISSDSEKEEENSNKSPSISSDSEEEVQNRKFVKKTNEFVPSSIRVLVKELKKMENSIKKTENYAPLLSSNSSSTIEDLESNNNNQESMSLVNSSTSSPENIPRTEPPVEMNRNAPPNPFFMPPQRPTMYFQQWNTYGGHIQQVCTTYTGYYGPPMMPPMFYGPAPPPPPPPQFYNYNNQQMPPPGFINTNRYDFYSDYNETLRRQNKPE